MPDLTPLQNGGYYDTRRMEEGELACNVCGKKLEWEKAEPDQEHYEHYADCCEKRYTLAALLYIAEDVF